MEQIKTLQTYLTKNAGKWEMLIEDLQSTKSGDKKTGEEVPEIPVEEEKK
jgi:hypothetical protein